MQTKIEHLTSVITPLDAAHGGLGMVAVLNGLWLDWLNPVVQIGITIGGAVYLYYMIRSKRMEWKLKRLEWERQKQD